MINKIHPAGILCDYDQLQTCEEFEFNSKGTLLKKKKTAISILYAMF